MSSYTLDVPHTNEDITQFTATTTSSINVNVL